MANPSYQEMKEFLAADTTGVGQWIEGGLDDEYVVAEINKNAEAQGIRVAWVYIEFPQSSYALLAFETTDKGLVFIDPLTKAEVKVKVGIRFYEDNGLRKPNWDDTIMEVVIAW